MDIKEEEFEIKQEELNIKEEFIPIAEPDANHTPQELELRTLLRSWDLETLADHLIAEKVYVDVLKITKPHHLERLLKPFRMGDQILFEYHLEKWRNGLEIPFANNTSLINKPALSSPAGTSSGSHFHPHSRSSTPESSVTPPSLATILNESTKGVILCEYYKKFGKFGDEQRTSLVSAIARFYEEKGTSMTLGTSYKLENEILERFPTEKLQYYRTSKRGKLYSKACNLKGTFKKSVKRHVMTNSSKAAGKKSARRMKDFLPESDAVVYIRALQFHNLSTEEFDSNWKACRQYRMSDIKRLENIAAIFNKWPFYKAPFGFRLINIDFDTINSNGDGLLSRWETTRDVLLNFLSSENIKDKSIKGSLEYIKTHEVCENSFNATLFWALHGYLVPTCRLVCKDQTGKKSVVKYTIKDSQESFAFLGNSQQALEDHVQHLTARKNSIQPFLLLVGEDITAVKDIFVYVNGVRYSFTNFLRAVDCCFKTFYVFGLSFPIASVTFWSFIEKCFYQINSEYSNPKIHILCNALTQ